jgi:hypothetical protein
MTSAVTGRVVAVVASGATDALALAMLEDVVDQVEQMREVQAALVVPPGVAAEVTDVTWPGMPVVEVAAGAPVADVLDAVAAAAPVAAVGAAEVAAVSADVPDLPVLLLGKLHSALTAAQVAVCPADDGRLVAVAARVPVPQWLRDAGVALDGPDGVRRLRAVAPARALHVGPGWHRVRGEDDARRLDPGLEGWDATRALLGR